MGTMKDKLNSSSGIAYQVIEATGGKWYGHSGMTHCPVCEGSKPALKVSDDASLPYGIFAHCFRSRCDFMEIKRAFVRDGVLSDDGSRPKPLTQEQIEQRQAAREKKENESRAEAFAVWSHWDSKKVFGTFSNSIEPYMAGRGVPITEELRPYFRNLRRSWPTNSNRNSSSKYGFGTSDRWCEAMVVPFTELEGEHVVGVHLTYFDVAQKRLEGDDARRMRGPIGLGAFKLGEIDSSGWLFVGEGVETTTSAWHCGLRPAWGRGSAGGVASLPLLNGVEHVVLMYEHDYSIANFKAVVKVARRYLKAGKRVSIIDPGNGDLNDLIQGKTFEDDPTPLDEWLQEYGYDFTIQEQPEALKEMSPRLAELGARLVEIVGAKSLDAEHDDEFSEYAEFDPGPQQVDPGPHPDDPGPGEPFEQTNDTKEKAQPTSELPPPYVARRLSDVEEEAYEWLWQSRLALKKINLIAGNPGTGKSQLTCYMAAMVSTAGVWADGSKAPLGSVIFISCEDDAADTIKPRLVAAGADLNKTHILDWTMRDAKRKNKEHFNIGEHIAPLRQLVRDLGDVKLIVIDPVTAYTGKADTYNTADVRKALTPIQTMAAEMRVCVVLISHLNKASGAEAMNRVNGSGAFVAVSRSSWLVGIDPGDEGKTRRILTPMKNNIGDHKTGFAYTIESQTYEVGGISIETSRVKFEENTVEISADDLLARPIEKDEDDTSDAKHERDTRLAEAMTFLAEELKDGARSAREVNEAAKDAGIKETTLKTARAKLGVKAAKQANKKWAIRLPPPGPESLINDEEM